MKRFYAVAIALTLSILLVVITIVQLAEFEVRMDKAEERAKEAEERGQEAEARAKEAEECGQEAEARAKEAERLALELGKYHEGFNVDTLSEECKIFVGDPLSPWLEGRMGCKLPIKARSINVEINDWEDYAYFIAGYEDPAYLNCVYDSGWQRGESNLALDPELY